MMIAVRRADKDDGEIIARLLRQAGISDRGVDDHLGHFLIVEEEGSCRTIGTVGLEVYGDKGLLRSFVMESDAWNGKTGLELIEVVLSYVRQSELREIYLLAGIASNIFEHFGFRPVEWRALPEAISQSAKSRAIRPDEGVPMVYRNLEPQMESTKD